MSERRVRRLYHNSRPDYSRPPLRLPEEARQSMLGRLTQLYGKQRARETWPELERILRVHHAHKPECLVEMDRQASHADRFTERDCILITYGDMVVDEHRGSPLKILAELLESPGFTDIFNTLHILPFFPSSSDRGFSVVDFRAVDPNLGSWQDIADIGKTYELMFDGVLNHASAESEHFQEFLNANPRYRNLVTWFRSPEELPPDQLRLIRRPRTSDLLTRFLTLGGPRWVWTTFSPDQVDLNFHDPAVLLWSIETLLLYVRRGADIVRLDAVTYIWAELGTTCASLEQTHQVIKLYRDVVNLVEPRVALLTETNVPHEENVSYFGDGSDEAHMVYNFALPPLVLHTFYTGDAGALSRWASELRYPSSTTTFLNILDTHDGIGLLGAKGILEEEEIERMIETAVTRGAFVSYRTYSDGSEKPYEINTTWYGALNGGRENEDLLCKVQRFVASKTLALALRGVPGMYFHGVLGTENDPEPARQSGHKRDINRAVVQMEELERDLEDPDSKLSVLRRTMEPFSVTRVSERAFHPGGAQRVLHLDPAIFAVMRVSVDGSECVAALTNVTDRPLGLLIPEEQLVPHGPRWKDLVRGTEHRVENGRLTLTFQPYDVVWLKALADGTPPR